MLPPVTPTDRLDEDELLDVLTALADGHFSARMSSHYAGRVGRIASTLNRVLGMADAFRTAVLRLTEELGVTGRLGGQMFLDVEPGGAWKDMADALDRMGANLTWQLRMASQAAEANALGVDGRRAPEADVRVGGEVRMLCRMINALADRAAGVDVAGERAGAAGE